VIDPVIAKPATAIYNAVGKPVVNAAESVVDGTVSGVANMAGGLVGLGGGGGGGGSSSADAAAAGQSQMASTNTESLVILALVVGGALLLLRRR
jgi:hypothetical protein